MATLTLKPGPRLLYCEEYDHRLLVDIDRYDELPQEQAVASSAHEYLYETLRQLDEPCLGDIVLLADGNAYLLGIYAQYSAAALVLEALRLRAEPATASREGAYLQLSTNESGDVALYAVLKPDVHGISEVRDGWELPFSDAHMLPIRFDPLIPKHSDSGSTPAREESSTVVEPKLGELLRRVFMYYTVGESHRDRVAGDDVDCADSPDDDEAHLAACDSELNEIREEMESCRDEAARSEEAGWWEE